MSFVGGRVHSLANISIYYVADHFYLYGSNLQDLPLVVKNRVIYLLCKRGLLNDTNLPRFLDPAHQELDLSECEVSDKALLSVSRTCKRLLKIDLNSPKGMRKGPTSEGIICCAEGCKYLHTVFLRRCENIGNRGIIALAENCKFLRQLNVSGCVLIGDDSLRALASQSVCLTNINLSGTSVTDVGVLCLANGVCNCKLKEVHLSNCSSPSDISVEAIVSSCHNLEVFIFHGCPSMTSRAQIILENNLLGIRNKMKHLTWTIY